LCVKRFFETSLAQVLTRNVRGAIIFAKGVLARQYLPPE
jgi:hypothetical protein